MVTDYEHKFTKATISDLPLEIWLTHTFVVCACVCACEVVQGGGGVCAVKAEGVYPPGL